MSNFWSLWIIVLTVVTIIGVTLLLFGNRKSTNQGPGGTTGHSHDGIEEYDNPLPLWWLYLFVISIVFGIGYLIAFPGLGNFGGVLGWTQVGQWEKEMAKADERYGEVFARYASMDVEQLLGDKAAIKMGRRMFANNCAQCHGSDAKGSFGFPNLTDHDWLYGGDAEHIKQSITNGRTGAMPGWEAALGEEGISQVSAYVMSLSNAHKGGDKTLVAAGKQKFQTFCVACHGADAKGNAMFGAPNLTDNTWLYGGSKSEIEFTIRRGRNGKMPAHKDIIGDDKIHLLTAFVMSLSSEQGGSGADSAANNSAANRGS